MESEFYTLLNNLLNPKKFPVMLSFLIVFFSPFILELLLILFYMQHYYSFRLILTIEAVSVLAGYAYVYLVIKIRIKRSLNRYREKRIHRLVGSFPAIIYLLSPGLISLLLGLLLLLPVFATPIGRKITRVGHIDPNIIYTLLELRYAK